MLPTPVASMKPVLCGFCNAAMIRFPVRCGQNLAGGVAALPFGRRYISKPQSAHLHRVVAHAHFDQAAQHLTSLVGSAESFAHVTASTLLTLADITPSDIPAAAQDAAQNTGGGGPFGFISDGLEYFLKVLDAGLVKLHVPYSYGFAIIILTLLVKAATFPLSRKQVESTMAMQAVAPGVRELQAKYKNDPERLQMETARLYKEAGVNPLAGCLPTLATLPIWFGLYRALSNVANEGLLTEGFFWIPSLAGPTTLAIGSQQGGGLSWLLPLKDGVPPLGWPQTLAYLLLPALLVVSQYAAQKLMSPQQQSNDPAQQQTQAILNFLPLMIGWFSLNVPSGLTLYWFTNNLLTTGQQLWLRKTIQLEMPTPSVIDVVGTVVKEVEVEEERRPTGKELGTRKKKRDVEAELSGLVGPTNLPVAAIAPPASSGGKKGGRGDKFKQIKAKEAARKAAKLAGGGQRRAPAETATAVKREAVPDVAPAKDSSARNGAHESAH